MAVKLTRITGETDEGYNIRVAEAEKLIADARGDNQGFDAVMAGLNTLGDRFAKLEGRQDSIEDMMKGDKARKDADEDALKKGDAMKRADAFNFSKRGDGESDEDMKARHDAEEEELAKHMKEAGSEDGKAKADAKKRRGDAEEAEKGEDKKKADAIAAATNPLSKVVEDLRIKIEGLTAQMPRVLTDEDRKAFGGAQARADAAYHAWGKSAPAPMQFEELNTYRVRLIDGLKEHSPTWKDNTMAAARADSHTLEIAEGTIFADAIKASRNPKLVPLGQLRERHSTTGAGHKVTDFEGDNKTWMSAFMPTGAFAKINPPNPTRH